VEEMRLVLAADVVVGFIELDGWSSVLLEREDVGVFDASTIFVYMGELEIVDVEVTDNVTVSVGLDDDLGLIVIVSELLGEVDENADGLVEGADDILGVMELLAE